MTNTAQDYMANDRFAELLGITLIDSGDDYARCEINVGDAYKNGLGTPHGAVIFTLADVAFAATCNSNQLSIGLQADIKYLKKPKGDTLIAEARAISTAKRTGHYRVDVTDEEGSAIAVFSSTAYRLPAR